MTAAFLILVAALLIADGVTTFHGLRLGAKEAHPVSRWLIETLGADLALVFIKLLQLGLVAWLALRPEWRGVAGGAAWMLAPIAALSALVVRNNLRVIRRRSGGS